MSKKNGKPNNNYQFLSTTALKSRISGDYETITNGEQVLELTNKHKTEVLIGKRLIVKCKNKKQKDFINLIDEKEIIICKGPAGVGKSYLSIVEALKLLQKPDNSYDKIYIITPAVESEESYGFLPGDINDKLSEYLFSTYYIIDKLIGKQAREKLIEKEIIKPLALGFLRGCNLDNCIMIFEEAQNSTKKSMKTVLTRIGYNSKFIISGDMEQVDRFKDVKESGLYDAFERLKSIEKIGVFEFDNEDIVRNPIIKDILDKY
jgi:phosphate starvation-inducible PhoH-like protein